MLLRVEGLSVYYYTLRGVVRAVENVNLEVGEGEVLGIGGESGCGKSTLAFALLRLVPPPGRIVSGRILVDGEDITKMSEQEVRRKIRWKKISMIFQGAMNALCPVFRVGDQIAEPLVHHYGVDRQEAWKRAAEVLRMVGLSEDIMYRYPHELSGGQKQRVMIAMAIVTNPKLVIADEPTTALDVVVQAQVVNLFKKLRDELSSSFIFITHDLSLLAELADKVAIMYAGEVVEYGPSDKVFLDPAHPYTRMLLESIPRIDVKRRLRWIPGQPPDLRRPPTGCRFHPRCPHATEKCRRERPRMVSLEPGWMVSCHLYGG